MSEKPEDKKEIKRDNSGQPKASEGQKKDPKKDIESKLARYSKDPRKGKD